MALTVSINSPGPSSINVSWNFGSCFGSNFSWTYNLRRNGVVYLSGSTANMFVSFNNLPDGSYLAEVQGFADGGFCDSGSSRTITIQSFCIPANETNIRWWALARFYGLSTSNVQLSGPNNPSTTESIFGSSDLPSTGSISKSRPNAVSELRGRCGGVMSWADANYFLS